MILNDGALLLNDQDLLQALGEAVGLLGLQGPGHAHLIHSNTDFRGGRLVNPHILQCLHDIQIGLARGDNAQPWIGAVYYDGVQVVDPCELSGSINFVFVQPPLLVQGFVRPARADAPGR